MQRETVKISALKAAPYNPRTISKEAAEGLTKSLERWGVVQEVVANRRTGHIVGGHQRVAALKKMGVKEVPVVWVDLDDVEEKALNVALNNPHISGEFDDTIAGLLAEIRDGIGPDDFEALKLDDLLPPDATVVEGNTDPDDVPETPEDPITKPGDLWVLGDHRLLCGDSTNPQHIERLMDGNKAAVTFTSPPYGVNLRYKSYKDSFSQTLQLIKDVIPIIASVTADYAVINFADIVSGSEIVGTSRPCQYLMGHHYFDLFRACDWNLWSQRIWKKPHAKVSAPWTCNSNRAAADWEHIYTFASPNASFNQRCNGSHFGVVDSSQSSETSVLDKHPGAFPVFLPETIVPIHAKRGSLVFEPFCGTGTTIIACERLGYKCNGMELDPAYCDVIVKRWEDFTGKKAVLEANDATG